MIPCQEPSLPHSCRKQVFELFERIDTTSSSPISIMLTLARLRARKRQTNSTSTDSETYGVLDGNWGTIHVPLFSTIAFGSLGHCRRSNIDSLDCAAVDRSSTWER